MSVTQPQNHDLMQDSELWKPLMSFLIIGLLDKYMVAGYHAF